MQLPQEFIDYTSALFGPQRWQSFLQSFNQEEVVSVRLNLWKCNGKEIFPNMVSVPWCRQGFWLSQCPSFTKDPLFHAV